MVFSRLLFFCNFLKKFYFPKTFLKFVSSLIYKATKRGAFLNDEELKKLIIISGSRYEPNKEFIEKLFNSILRALKKIRQKSDGDFSDGDLKTTEEPP